MKISGFTFIRNGSILGYPYIESIQSLINLCDEVIVAVGNSDDDTLTQIRKLNSNKLKIIETQWNEIITDRGYTYAQQKLIAQFNCTGDWAFYLECDEIIHEKDIPLIKQSLLENLHNKKVEAFVFNYHHFYGDINTIACSPRWYKKAPRIIRNTLRSWAPDGLFWLIMDKNKKGRYPKAKLINCYLYHYGHVRLIKNMDEKNKRVEKYWGKNPKKFETYANIDSSTLYKFEDTHPKIINNWLENCAEQNFTPNPNYKLSKREKKHRLMILINKILKINIDWSKKHYKLIK
jgi:glycosyltransferase involved in cell wall biosynthesis